MNSKVREYPLHPPPKIVKIEGRDSHLPNSILKNLPLTRNQLVEIPESVGLCRTSIQGSDPQAYRLTVTENAIRIEANTETGWHYGLLTLAQLAHGSGSRLPQCEIEDWPDFKTRGIMLDVSRNKVPTLETLFSLIDLFSSWKINQLQLYIEHTFAYAGHEEVWKNASPYTDLDIHILDTYCHNRFIELVPNLNCFGHMHRWLIHDRYRPLAECPNGGETDYGYRKDPQGLCPLDPGSIALAEDLIKNHVSCFRSRQVNVGCDETIDLGNGRSKQEVQSKGRGQVYLDYLKKVHGICRKSGYTMQFWSDIVLKYPDLVTELPRDCIGLNWGYEANHPFASETKCLKQSGIEFYVCPGTSSWNSIGGRTKNMLQNIRNATDNGLSHGAGGLIITDWGDNGHWQPLLASFPGFAYGAALAWNAKHGQSKSLDKALDKYVFLSPGWGKLLLEIGNLDQSMKIRIHNRSILFNLLQDKTEELRKRKDLDAGRLQKTLEIAEHLQSDLNTLCLTSPIEKLFESEFSWIIGMLIHACQRGLKILGSHSESLSSKRALDLREQHKQLWKARNRPGGYSDSRALFDVLMKD